MGCRRKRDCYNGRCTPCRRPPDRRQLLEAGIPWGSADALAWIAKKCKGQRKSGKEITTILEFVHPVLMENIVVGNNGVFRLKSKKYQWLRRTGWVRA